MHNVYIAYVCKDPRLCFLALTVWVYLHSVLHSQLWGKLFKVIQGYRH